MKFLIFVLGLTVTSAARIRDFPKNFPKCDIKDPNINECMLKASELAKPFLIKGMPELNIPALDPFEIQKINLNQRTQSINIDAILTNVRLEGLQSYKITDFKFDVPNLEWHIKADLVNMKLAGNYKLNGTLLGAPVEGNGHLTSVCGKVGVDGVHRVKTVLKNGLNYTAPVTTKVTLAIKDPSIELDGLFGGDKSLAQLTNNVIKDNIDMLIEDMRPVLERVIGSIFEQYLFNNIENKVPFDRMYSKQ